ncbi:MAG: UvrD-helicase domain-containing protein, partial [Gemmatimonadales bacterium]
MTTPLDQPARKLIADDLDTNLLVEAGAGSGKTTALIGRLLSLVQRGTPVERIAAVTFTRKAANELREKFQQALEQALAAARTSKNAPLVSVLDRALQDVEQAFIGTIHSFCARLLREHTLEAGLDPAFRELDETEAPVQLAAFWERWLVRQRADNATELARLSAIGVDPRSLADAFADVVQYPDVTFPAAAVDAPTIAAARIQLDAFLSMANAAMPDDEPDAGWDSLQTTVRRLGLFKRLHDWNTVRGFCDSIVALTASKFDLTQNRWSDTKEGKKAAKALSEAGVSLYQDVLAPVQRQWWEHRYPAVMAFLLQAAKAYETERFATGRLTFEDLLLGAARLLRTHAGARRALGERYRHLLVDEFQDTDPIQAEVCLLLASDPADGVDWRAVTPRPGALFVVGDPKQSIYRFRRADIQTYEQVKQRFAGFGAVLRLTQNFRSVAPIGELVTTYFDGPFKPDSSAEQAAFAPLITVHEAAGHDGVRWCGVTPDQNYPNRIIAADAKQVAAWIATRIAAENRNAEDFLVLTRGRKALEHYARAIAEQGVPVTTSGATLPQEHELQELVVVLRALADPDNPVHVAAALEGLFFGLSPADLYEARETGLHFRITYAPPGESGVARALCTLHEWWRRSQRDPADVLLAHLLDDTGLLPYAASQPLGDNRGGALLHLVEAVRGTATDPAPDLRSAIAVVERLLLGEAPDALLLPGRGRAVRVMNLHKAKGLEAEVVILAAPTPEREHPTRHAIARSADGSAVGGLLVSDEHGTIIAQPAGWAEMAAREAAFEAAEAVRLLYVAVTRAKRELVVSRLIYQNKSGPAEDKSAWSPLGGMLDSLATEQPIVLRDPPGRVVSPVTLADIDERRRSIVQQRQAAVAAGWEHRTVTQEAKRALELPDADQETRRRVGQGRGWGRAVHRVLEARGRGRMGASLSAYARAVAAEERVEDVARLLAIVARLDAAGHWEVGANTMVESPIVSFGPRDGQDV